MLGKETIDTRTRGVTKGQHGSSNTNYQNAGRELLTLDEVRLLDNANALIFIRGEKPIMDKKFDILSHPNIKYTEEGGALPYRHIKNDRLLSEDIHFNDIDTMKFIEFRQEELKHEESSEKAPNGSFGRRHKKNKKSF